MNINLRRGQQGNWEGNMGCTDFDLPAYYISEYIFGNMFFQMNTLIKLTGDYYKVNTLGPACCPNKTLIL